MRTLLVLSLLLVSVSAAACEKDVKEVRRTTPGPVAPGTAARSATGAPAAPSGEPVTFSR